VSYPDVSSGYLIFFHQSLKRDAEKHAPQIDSVKASAPSVLMNLNPLLAGGAWTGQILF